MKLTLDIFFPQKCGVCGKVGDVLCDDCQSEIKEYELNLLRKEIIRTYENTEINVDKFFILKYEGIVRKMLINYKFNDYSYLVDTFVKIISNNKKICRFLKNYDIIIPVPLHKKRKLERGYNQVELIANKLDIKMDNNSLIKIKNIKPQSMKTVKQRIADVKNVYSIQNVEKIQGKRLLIFDDIYTTGSTVNECIKVLSKYTKNIGVLILAKD